MAKIKGIEVKALKMFRSRNGYGFEANIYLNNKKIGNAYDEGVGGEMTIRILPEYREDFSTIVSDYYNENPSTFDGEDSFIEELIALKENENSFKKLIKKGFITCIELRYVKRTTPINEYKLKPSNFIGLKNNSIIPTILEKYKPVEYTVYSSLEDFNIA